MNFVTHFLCEIKTSGDVNPNDILYTVPETNKQPKHLKIGRAPKGNDHIPTIPFLGASC